MADHVRDAAGAIGDVGNAVRPGFQQHQAERIGAARQCKHVKRRIEITLLGNGDRPETAHPPLCESRTTRRERRPEAHEVRHLRPREQQIDRPFLLPKRFECLEQIVGPLLPAVIGEMADDNGIVRQIPVLPGCRAIAAGAFRRFDAEPLNDNLPLRQSESKHGIAFARRLHEDAVGFVEQPRSAGEGVAAPDAVVRIIGVAEMQEWGDEKWDVVPPSQPPGAGDRKRIRKCRGVNRVERALTPNPSPGGRGEPGVMPHAERDRIARHRQALPEAVRIRRQRLEQPAPAGHAPERIAMNRDARFGLDTCRQAQSLRRPECVQRNGVRRENGDGIAVR